MVSETEEELVELVVKELLLVDDEIELVLVVSVSDVEVVLEDEVVTEELEVELVVCEVEELELDEKLVVWELLEVELLEELVVRLLLLVDDEEELVVCDDELVLDELVEDVVWELLEVLEVVWLELDVLDELEVVWEEDELELVVWLLDEELLVSEELDVIGRAHV